MRVKREKRRKPILLGLSCAERCAETTRKARATELDWWGLTLSAHLPSTLCAESLFGKSMACTLSSLNALSAQRTRVGVPRRDVERRSPVTESAGDFQVLAMAATQ